ncbi:MAG TPA: VWA-like domain-containing protein, partial [Phycisphaerae bacterium]|nr:VWA-like domain-containing protein [Phycisphaerae bacterium]
MPELERIRVARAWCETIMPYMGAGLYNLSLVETDKVPLMGVDRRWRCYWNRSAIATWSIAQIGTVLFHELSHCLKEHHQRAADLGVGKGNPLNAAEIWNCAADADINDDLVAVASLDFPVVPCLPENLVKGEPYEDGLPAEIYYKRLLNDLPSVKVRMPWGGSCADGLSRPHELPDDDEATPGIDKCDSELIAREVAEAIRRRGALEPGSIPDGLERWAEEVLAPPKVRWQDETLSLVKARCAQVSGNWDYTYGRPSRRSSISKDVVFPAMQKPIPDVCAVIDTSGSMSDKQTGYCVSELAHLLRMTGCTLSVMCVDAAVHHVKKAFGKVSRQLFGGGGTDMGVGVEAADKLKPDMIVVLTDGYTR